MQRYSHLLMMSFPTAELKKHVKGHRVNEFMCYLLLPYLLCSPESEGTTPVNDLNPVMNRCLLFFWYFIVFILDRSPDI